MGLAKKLGNASSARNSIPEDVAVEYKWSSQSYTLQDILKKFKLPCVVHCPADQCSIVWSDFHFDFRFPLLLYSKRTVRKVHARNLNKITKEEIGPPIAIPEDYEGWFGASPKGKNQTKRHTRIQSIADSNTQQFLVCSKCPAFTRSIGPNGDVDYISRDILPGEVFKRVCVLDGEFNDPDIPPLVLHNGPCLECLDEKDDNVIIPFSRRAIAYEIAELYPNQTHKVFPTQAIFSAGTRQLPRILSLVYGERPILDYSFTDDIRCYSIFTEETILAGSMDESSPMCLELTLDSTVKFKLSLNETAIKRTCEYGNAFHMCKASGDSFLSGIKVSFSVQPEMVETDESFTNPSEIQSISDMQEMDANSEFEIAWNSDHNTESPASNSTIVSMERNSTSVFKQKDIDVKLGNNEDGYSPRSKSKLLNNKNGGDNPRNDFGNPPEDFTEQEIANLMVRKGMIQGLGASSSSDLNLSAEMETIRKNREKSKTFCFFNEGKDKMCDTNYSVSGNGDDNDCEINEMDLTDSELDNYSDYSMKHNSRLESDHPNNLNHFEEQTIDHSYDHEESDSSDTIEISLDETEFVAAVCKPANEYNEDDDSYHSEEDSQTESDLFNNHENNESAINHNSMSMIECEVQKEEKPIRYSSFFETTDIEFESHRGSNQIDENYKSEIKPDTTKYSFESSSCKELRTSSAGSTISSVDFTPTFENVDNNTNSIDKGSKKNKRKSKSKSESSSILNKFKSETNVSKLFDRLKRNDSGQRQMRSSSKTKILQLKSTPNDLSNKLISKSDDMHFEGADC